jgi:hypothetical protein
VSRPLLKDAMPQLADELRRLLEGERQTDLAVQVSRLRLVDRCRCGDAFCATLYAAPPPNGAWGPGHENVILDPEQGDLILDVVKGEITCIEVLYRDDIRALALTLFP